MTFRFPVSLFPLPCRIHPRLNCFLPVRLTFGLAEKARGKGCMAGSVFESKMEEEKEGMEEMEERMGTKRALGETLPGSWGKELGRQRTADSGQHICGTVEIMSKVLVQTCAACVVVVHLLCASYVVCFVGDGPWKKLNDNGGVKRQRKTKGDTMRPNWQSVLARFAFKNN
jgi:hypothetical protein